MDKPTLLLNPGTGWAATTPMWLTLQRDNRYCHTGHRKEPLWLAQCHYQGAYEKMFAKTRDEWFRIQNLGKNVNEHICYWGFDIDENNNWTRFRKHLGWHSNDSWYQNAKELNYPFNGIYPEYHDNPYGVLCTDTRKWSNYQTQIGYTDKTYHYTSDYLKWLFNPITIAKYIDYYTRHWHFIKDAGYHAVADFCNFNMNLPAEFWAKTAPILKEYFNVKVLMEFRDPIRRLFSELGSTLQLPDCSTPDVKHMADRWYKHNAMPDKGKGLNQYFIEMILEEKLCHFGVSRYADNYLKFVEYFGEKNVHHVIMEELWDPRLSKPVKKLSKFLEFPIKHVHRNCYFPDLGDNAPHYEELEDQWTSDLETLKQHTIDMVMPEYIPVYKRYKEVFGTIPTSWNNPYV
tara:strand:- start:4186 stop:5391 length:1206 start_codon:yes stop_codon:yes gene_type:complete